MIEDLFEQYDIMSLYVQQTKDTMFMVNNEFLNKLKKTDLPY